MNAPRRLPADKAAAVPTIMDSRAWVILAIRLLCDAGDLNQRIVAMCPNPGGEQ